MRHNSVLGIKDDSKLNLPEESNLFFEPINEQADNLSSPFRLPVKCYPQLNSLITAFQERLYHTLESITDALFCLDRTWRVTYWNKAAENMFDIKRKEILDKVFWDVFPKSIGSTFYQQYHLALQENRSVHFVTCGYYTGRWVEARAYPSEFGLTIYLNDITERKNLENEVARLDRLNIIGQMAAGIGHEVRNPLTTIRGFLQLLSQKERYAEDKEYFDLMISEVDRANLIITEFLSLAKNKNLIFERQNLNFILQSILPLIQADGLLKDKDILLEAEDIPDLLLEEKEIRQLVLNLVRNGVEATAPGGIIKIRTYREGNAVVLAVQDSGEGIAPAVLEKIGTPFFTTKDTGTGLGLAICYGIASRHNAQININTSPEGSIFSVRFKIPDKDEIYL